MKVATIAELLARFAPRGVEVDGAIEYSAAIVRKIVAEATTNRFAVVRLSHRGVTRLHDEGAAHESWMQAVFDRNGAAWALVERAPPDATFAVELVSRDAYYAGRTGLPVELRSDEELEQELRSLDGALALAAAHAGVEPPPGALALLDELRRTLARRRASDPARLAKLFAAQGIAAPRRLSNELPMFEARVDGRRALVTLGAAADRVAVGARGALPLVDVRALDDRAWALVEVLPEGARPLLEAELSVEQRRQVLAAMARGLIAVHAAPRRALGLRPEAIFVDANGALAGFSARAGDFARVADDPFAPRRSEEGAAAAAFAALARVVLDDADDADLDALLERALNAPPARRPTFDELHLALTARGAR